MHPTDANYVVTVNSVIFPKIDSGNIFEKGFFGLISHFEKLYLKETVVYCHRISLFFS